jgi:hypothetical protein
MNVDFITSKVMVPFYVSVTVVALISYFQLVTDLAKLASFSFIPAINRINCFDALILIYKKIRYTN